MSRLRDHDPPGTAAPTVRVLAIADEVDDAIGPDTAATLRPDLIVSCGDLPPDYLEYVVTVFNVPLLWVPGNHDPRYRTPSDGPGPIMPQYGVLQTLQPHMGRDEGPFEPGGCTCIDGRATSTRGLMVAGLGGSVRYKQGPHQYTQREMRRRARRLRMRATLRNRRRSVDLLVTHSPPLGVGDGDDAAHRGFEAFHGLVRALKPKVLVHGHVHPFGRTQPDRRMGSTLVINAVPRRLLEVPA